MPDCLLEMGISAPRPLPGNPQDRLGPDGGPYVLGLFPAALCALSPRLEPAPSGCWQLQWACYLFLNEAPRAHFHLCRRREGWVIFTQPAEQWPF